MTDMAVEHEWNDIHAKFRSAIKINLAVVVLITVMVFVVWRAHRAFDLSYAQFALSSGWAFAYCTFFAIWNRRGFELKHHSPTYHRNGVGIGLYLANLASIAVLVHFTGGAQSLFILLFALLALMCEFIVPPAMSRWMIAVMLAVYGAQLVIEHLLQVAHGAAPRMSGLFEFTDAAHRNLVWSTATMYAAVVVTTLLGVRIGRELFSTLGEQRAQIAAARDTLEERVRERTADLQRALVEVRGAYAALEQDREQLARFNANVAHELRTPLNILQGSVANVLDGVYGSLGEGQERALGHLRDNVEKLRRIMETLLDVAKSSAGKIEIHREQFSPVSEIRNIARELESVSSGRRVEVVADADAAAALALTDRFKFGQILTNLIENALKYAPDGPVRIVVRSGASSLSIEVRDEGPGVAPEEARLIFEPFARGRAANRKSGSGLGLSLARSLARLLGGDVVLQEHAGAGAIFVLTLPPADSSSEVRIHP
ncbi:MAG: HAMP domain-containing histidine kinase [Deltaproteobacteria bacterium]|nr:HAMP domain-containing histidine kinase [Deltaproteobacteria bacterium]